MKIFRLAALALAIPIPAFAQDLGSALLFGLGNEAVEKGGDFLDDAPKKFNDFLDSAEKGQEFPSDAACLGSLQMAVSAGTLLANLLPFSSVETLEDNRGPVGRFRILVNGEKHHFEAFCRQSTITATPLSWGAGDSTPRRVPQSTFDAAAGIMMLLHAQGAFDKERTPDTVAAPSIAGNGTSDVNGATDRPSGPPLSKLEKTSFANEVASCWNIGALSSEAASTPVEVSVQMNADGTLIASSIRLTESHTKPDSAAQQGYEAARRALIRCGARGYDLPAAKYSRWKNLTILFTPTEGVRVQ